MKNSVTVQIVQHLRPGGIETLSLALLGQARNPHYIVSLEGTLEEAIAQWPRLAEVQHRLHFLDKPAGKSPATLMQLYRLLKELGATAVHSHHIGPLLYGGMAARLLGIQHLVHTEHDSWHLRKPAHRRLQKYLLRLLKPVLVADCATVADDLAGFFKNYPVQVVMNGVDTRHFCPLPAGSEQPRWRRRLGLATDAKLVGCAARLEPEKGLDKLLVTLARLPAHYHLAIAGNGSQLDNLKAKARALQLAERVHFLGRIDEMPTFYRGIDLFCLPSLNEGLPLSPLEAQATGVPVVMNDVGGCREILCPHSGRLVKAGDTQGAAKAIRTLLEQPPKASPRRFVEHKASLSVMARHYQHLMTDDTEVQHV